MSQTNTEPIDAVVTWVDGNDPSHAEKRAKALRDEGLITSDQLPTGHHKTRFIDNGELEWCIKSIRKFAPWIRNIYLVTDNQIPAFLNNQTRKRLNVQVVDHTEVFKSYEWALPTFNTRSIESVLWRIPGLSEKFIYFNDDFVLTAPLTKEHFFKGRKVVVRGNWRKITHYGKFRLELNHLFSKVIKKLLGITRSMHLLLQIRSAQLCGFKKRYFYVPHVPHPVKKSTLESHFKNNSQQFEKNIRYKFRDTKQFSAIFLSYHLEIANENAELIPPKSAMLINGEMDLSPAVSRKVQIIQRGDIEFLCIQGMEVIRPKQKKHLIDSLSALIEN